jgi:hypothetical protein
MHNVFNTIPALPQVSKPPQPQLLLLSQFQSRYASHPLPKLQENGRDAAAQRSQSLWQPHLGALLSPFPLMPHLHGLLW